MEIILAEPIFKSLQWEWPNTWLPSIFIRFYGCNLCCKWCDSLYAVNNPESVIKMTVEEIVEKIKELNCTNIIFTWWEPSLFSDKIQAIQDMLGAWYTYEIETNGSNPIKNRFEQINISPKLSNSWNKKYELKALNGRPEETFYPVHICFKFVAKWKEDFDEIQEYIKENDIPTYIVYIMPMWTDDKSQDNKEVLQFCLDNWYHYCQRMHILLFWNKKWV